MNQTTAAPQPPRLRSLDVFRGFDIVLMFVVNLSADPTIPRWVEHAGWNDGKHGQGLADFVFPWFLFIMGVAIPFSMNSGRGRSLSPAAKVLEALRRGTIIYLLGILIFICKSAPERFGQAGTPISFDTLKHWDILPLIGFCYALGVVLSLFPRFAWVAFVAFVLVAKWWTMPDLTATVGLDRDQWMHARTDLEHSIRAIPWWGTMITQGLPAASTTVLGMLAGAWLRSTRTPLAKSTVLISAGALTTALALAVAMLPHGIPFSKDFFTSSYVLLSAGTAAVGLGLTHLVLDSLGWANRLPLSRVASFLEAFGKNAIAVYVVVEILWAAAWYRWIAMGPDGPGYLWSSYKAWLQHWTTPALGAWLAIAGYILLYSLFAATLHRRKIYLKV